MAAPAGEKLSKPTFRDFYGDVHEDVGSSKGHWVYDKGQRSWRSGPPPKFKLSHRRVGDHLAHDKEWLAGPAARHYRRPVTEAREMTIESCPDGAKVKRSDTDVMSKPSTICNLCRKTSPEPLKRCARCLAVSYCSKDCQRKDFKKHQIFCWCCDRYDIARARVYPAVRFFLDLRHPRDYSVLLADMPTEQQYNDGAWCNLLVEVVSRVQHFFHYSILVSDLSGELRRIIFYDETKQYTDPNLCQTQRRPQPRDFQAYLVPGHFLLLMGVHWRHFMDGTDGIRINDLASVYVINMADHVWPSKYRKHMEVTGELYRATLV